MLIHPSGCLALLLVAHRNKLYTQQWRQSGLIRAALTLLEHTSCFHWRSDNICSSRKRYLNWQKKKTLFNKTSIWRLSIFFVAIPWPSSTCLYVFMKNLWLYYLHHLSSIQQHVLCNAKLITRVCDVLQVCIEVAGSMCGFTVKHHWYKDKATPR